VKIEWDHTGVAFPPRAGAQHVEVLSPPFNLGRPVALVGEGGEDEPIHPLGFALGERSGTDGTRRLAKEMEFRTAGLAQQNGHCRLEVLDPTRYIGIVVRASRVAITVMIHGPDVEAVSGKDVHQRIFGAAGNVQIVTGSG
jgi:hypothetical protein